MMLVHQKSFNEALLMSIINVCFGRENRGTSNEYPQHILSWRDMENVMWIPLLFIAMYRIHTTRAEQNSSTFLRLFKDSWKKSLFCPQILTKWCTLWSESGKSTIEAIISDPYLAILISPPMNAHFVMDTPNKDKLISDIDFIFSCLEHTVWF